jgi:hypothetical protein
MTKMSFLAGFFILFQSNTLGMAFGIGFDSILLIFLGFILSVSLFQIISLLIYSLTNGSTFRKNIVKLAAVAVFIPLVIVGFVQYIGTADVTLAIAGILRSPASTWVPIIGWVSECVYALIIGQTGTALLFFGLIIVTGVILVVYIMKSNPDYYEDVLVATETIFERKRNIAEGQVNTGAYSTRQIKVSKTGLSGIGARTIFIKHLRESFRANRLGLWGVPSVIIVASSIIAAYFMRQDNNLVILMQGLMWAQIFLVGTGRGLVELYSHYIYLIPDKPVSKLLWSNLEIVLKTFGESLIIYIVSGVIMKEHPLIIFMVISVYTLFTLTLLGINYISLRYGSADISTGMLVLIYIIAVLVIMSPGVVAAIVIGSLMPENGALVGLLILAGWELLVSIISFTLSKGILHNCDLPSIKVK